MMTGIISILLGIFGSVVKNPIVQKILLFSVFFGLLTLALNAVKAVLFPYFQTLGTFSQNVTFILCKVDLLGALNLYISALLAIYVINQTVSYFKNV